MACFHDFLLCVIALLLFIFMVFVVKTYDSMPMYVPIDMNGAFSWIRWYFGNPYRETWKIRSRSEPIIAVVGNAPLSDEHRRQIQAAAYVIRINKMQHMKEHERIDMHIVREMKLIRVLRTLPMPAWTSLGGFRQPHIWPCILIVMSKTGETEDRVAIRESTLLKTAISNSPPDTTVGAVRVEEISNGYPMYAKTNFPESLCGPSSGYVAVIAALDLSRETPSQVHVFGMSRNRRGRGCEGRTEGECDIHLKRSGFRICHNELREEELLEELQKDHEHIKIFWAST